MGIVYSGVIKEGEKINFSQFRDLVDQLRFALQQKGFEPDDVVKISPMDKDGNRIDETTVELVDKIRIDAIERSSISIMDIENLVSQVWRYDNGLSWEKTIHDSGAEREW